MSLGVPLLIGVLVACVGAGAFVTYFTFAVPVRARASRADERRAEVEEALERMRSERDALAIKKTESDATLTAERKSYAVRVKEQEEMIEKKFKALASDVLGKNSKSFLNLASQCFEKHKTSADGDLEKCRMKIETLVKPIDEGLVKFERKIGEIEKERKGDYSAVAEQVKSLRSETGRLAQALRQPKTRGRWGEYHLRNVLEMAGMREHVDFEEQKTVGGEDGRLRPDVIVRLPGGRSIIVDAKTPLEGYLAAVEADKEEDRKRHMDAHVGHVRDHVRKLASKEYWKELPDTLDFVVMFIPGEAFYAAAIERDPALFEKAFEKKVLICSPTIFLALVKAIAYGWQQQKFAENTQKVEHLARELYDRIKVFGKHMGGLGDSLRQAVKRYDEGVDSLEKRVLPTARKFEALGVVSAEATLPGMEPIDIKARELHAPELTAHDREDGDDEQRPRRPT